MFEKPRKLMNMVFKDETDAKKDVQCSILTLKALRNLQNSKKNLQKDPPNPKKGFQLFWDLKKSFDELRFARLPLEGPVLWFLVRF